MRVEEKVREDTVISGIDYRSSFFKLEMSEEGCVTLPCESKRLEGAFHLDVGFACYRTSLDEFIDAEVKGSGRLEGGEGEVAERE